MTDRVSRALRPLRGGVVPVLDAASEERRRERVAARVLEVSRALSARRERRRRVAFHVALAALVGGVTCALLLWLGPWRGPAPVAVNAASEVRLIAGQASLRDGAGLAPLAPGEHTLPSGSELVTGAEQSAELVLSSRTTLRVAPASQVGLSRERPDDDAFEERVRLRAGGVTLRVPKLGARGKVAVETPDALVEVHGTQFSVRLIEHAPRPPYTEVRVHEGRVLVRSGEQRQFLGAGDVWSSRREEKLQVPPVLPPVAADPAPGLAAPQEVDKSARRETSRARTPRRARPSPPLPSELAAQNRLLEAAELARKSGLPALALRRLDELIARYPDAELAHNARVERFRLLGAVGRPREAAAAARDYLQRHPHGFARAEAERWLEASSDGSP